MAGKKRTTAMELAWVKAQKEKQRKAEARDRAKEKRDGAKVRAEVNKAKKKHKK